jgi:hypothetical protein
VLMSVTNEDVYPLKLLRDLQCASNPEKNDFSYRGFNGHHHLCYLGRKHGHNVTRPPAVAETRWAGILPQIAWCNEHISVCQL